MKIKVIQNVLKTNDEAAEANRKHMNAADVLALNITSAPGSGKTSLIKRTMEMLGAEFPCAVLVGDLQTSRDAERMADAAAQVTQINTGRGCHLSANQVFDGLATLELNKIAYLFIENVGNMVCPAGFDLGEHKRVAMLSTPEGDDKVAKYPTLFQAADVVVLNKIDLIDLLGYDVGRVQADLSKINTRAPLIQVSAQTGDGLAVWLDWLQQCRAGLKAD
ncbi:MAG: hydrogenase nickel incorporation protein HypB [Planctomycetota bacterium]